MAESAGAGLLSDCRRVLIVMLSALGDAVHVLPLLNALKAHQSELEITWIIQPVPHELVAQHPNVDRFELFQRVRGRLLAGELRRASSALSAHSFDLAIGLQVYLKAGLLLWGSGARLRLGFDWARARDAQWLFSTHRIPARPAAHVQDQYFEFLDYLGVPRGPLSWGLDLTEAEKASRTKYFADFSRPVCGIVLGTSKTEKNWSPEGYARVVAALESDFGMDVLLLGGPSDVEGAAARRIEELLKRRVAQGLGPGVRRLLWQISGCDLLISPDTGPLHMARALEVPVVGLYGFTNPKRTGPYRKFTELVVDGFAHSPDEDYGVASPNRPGGMRRVTVDAVLAKVDLARRSYTSSHRQAT